ncbi:hypothetical protein TNCV_3169301 [Trichonephila clavipes]|nr:hypothetical protein TNCV_3169301 [Trichonephila clavipes]
MLKLKDMRVALYHGYIWRLKILVKMSGETFDEKEAGKVQRWCTASVDDRRTNILRLKNKRMSSTFIRSYLNDSGVSVSSKSIRRILAYFRLSGIIPRKKTYLNLQQR